MKELLEAAKSAEFNVTFFADKTGLNLYVAHQTDKAAIAVFGGPDAELAFEDATRFIRNYEAFITNAAPCSKQ